MHGACVDGVADYTCECDVAYEGNNCDVYVGKLLYSKEHSTL